MIFICVPFFIFDLSVGNRLGLELDFYDREITHILKNPYPDEHVKLMKYLKEYNKNLSFLLYLIDKKERYVIQIAKKMWGKEGPTFLKLNIDNDLLKETFDWEDFDMYQLHFLFGATKILWFDIKELNPKGKPYFRDKDYFLDLYERDKKGELNELIEFTKPDDFS